MADEKPSFWSAVWAKLKAALVWCSHNLLAPLVALIVIVAAIAAIAMGLKPQIGGLLGKLFGKEEPKGPPVIDLANSIDKDRIGPDGTLIQPGTPDSQGHTQVVVVPIQDPGLFSDPKKVVFTPPGETKPVEVVLPDGVTNKDVEHVIVVSPEIKVVSVKDSSGVTGEKIDDLLKKYGGS